MKSMIIGIAGGTGSGKTTVAKNIRKLLPQKKAVLIDYDSYYKDHTSLPKSEREKLNYDHPDSLDNELLVRHLQQLRSGKAVEKPIYNFVKHARETKTTRIEAAPVIIVEGILILADQHLRDILDIKIFVDTDADIRVFRRIRRDMEKRGRSFGSIRNQYYTTVRPMHLRFVEPSKRWADIIIPEGGENKIALNLVVVNILKFLDNSLEYQKLLRD
ncbi:MAG: uridine kinase [Deltaproteobacteria bacterium]|jgi:uridine kinase|nr:uridine kinase [Deltaproteobacteria bacterium]